MRSSADQQVEHGSYSLLKPKRKEVEAAKGGAGACDSLQTLDIPEAMLEIRGDPDNRVYAETVFSEDFGAGPSRIMSFRQ